MLQHDTERKEIEDWFGSRSISWSENYSKGNRHFKQRFDNVHQLLENRQNCDRALDIGCGTGEISASVSMRFQIEVVGLDISEQMVGLCRKHFKNKNLDFRVGDITKLNFPDSAFHLVLSLSVLEWIKEYDNAIAEVVRVLKPNGQWIVSIPNWRSPFRKIELFFGKFQKDSYLKIQQNRILIDDFIRLCAKNKLVLNRTFYHVLPGYYRNIFKPIGKYLGMMCIMSFKKDE